MSNEIDLDHVPARRRALRLPGYDYAQAGAYFVTICTRGRICVLGDVVDGEVRLSELGVMVNSVWSELPRHYAHVRLDAWVVMPNHVHGIVLLKPDDDMAGAGLKPRAGLKPAPTGVGVLPSRVSDGSRHRGVDGSILKPKAGLKPAPTGPKIRHGLPEVVRAFKTFSARRVNAVRGGVGTSFWQRNYYEHVIRDEASLDRIRQYIVDNPARWDEDPENPASKNRRP